jgi:REP element-mobilizing transposase RayT
VRHKQWYSRDYIPHFDHPGVVQTINFRLADALPLHLLDQLAKTDPNGSDPQRRKRIEAWLDAGHGSCVLRNPAIAELVERALFHFDGERYLLIEWVVMPNHVHVMGEIRPQFRLPDVMQSWKSFTAHEANKLLGKSGQFWAEEYFDRYIRDQRHFDIAAQYIRENPVRAGLITRPEEWPFGSARFRK